MERTRKLAFFEKCIQSNSFGVLILLISVVIWSAHRNKGLTRGPNDLSVLDGRDNNTEMPRKRGYALTAIMRDLDGVGAGQDLAKHIEYGLLESAAISTSATNVENEYC